MWAAGVRELNLKQNEGINYQGFLMILTRRWRLFVVPFRENVVKTMERESRAFRGIKFCVTAIMLAIISSDIRAPYFHA